MKAYLSSKLIPNRTKYLSLFKTGSKCVGLVTNGLDLDNPKDVALYKKMITQLFKDMGFTILDIDLKQFIGKEEELKHLAAGLDGIWVSGGNTFYLNYVIQESGLSTFLKEKASEDFVYSGESAGAVAAGLTLHGIELLDNPNDAKKILWDGLGIIDYGIIPHWNEYGEDDHLKLSEVKMQKHANVITLRDDQFILSHDSSFEVLEN